MVTAIVEIVSTPAGEAPEAVRKAWIGCIFASIFFPETPSRVVGVETGKPALYKSGSWGTLVDMAIAALEYKKTETGADRSAIDSALAYWKGKRWPPETMLMFKELECKVLS